MPVDPALHYVDERCKVVSERDAAEMDAYLEEVTPEPGNRSFRNDAGGVSFMLVPLAPHEDGCAPRVRSEVPVLRYNLIQDPCVRLPPLVAHR